MLITEPPGNPWALDNTRVLVVDDQVEIHDDFNEMLPSDPTPHASDRLAATFDLSDTSPDLSLPRFELLHAASGEEACRLVREQHEQHEPIAVAYVDIRMPPGIDGVETVSRVREIDDGIEVVLMTAYSNRPLPAIIGDRELLHKLLYVRKPFTREEIQQITLSLLKKWHVERGLADSRQTLAENHRRLEAVLDSTGDAIAMYNPDGRLVFANQSYEDLLAEPADTLRELRRELALARFKESTAALTAERMPTGGAVVEHIAGEYDGPLFYRSMYTVRYAAAGEKIGDLVVYRDLSQETRIESMTAEVETLRAALETQYSFAGIIGTSRPMQVMCATMKQVADTDISVLVHGESGTGKEMVAKALHFNSRRRKHPFLAINCAALPETLVESELFGHERGAFTGATQQRAGYFEQASGGTLLLDEIGDMSLELQAKLLRVLQEREIRRLGGNRTIKVDVRVVAATNRNLDQAIRDRTFREDLYYRLAEVKVQVPPLRERREDIPLLAVHFLEKHASRANKSVPALSTGASALLSRYSWPGNVRELENAIAGSLARETTNVLRTASLPPEIVPAGTVPSVPPTGTLADIERRAIEDTVERCGQNMTVAARVLGIGRATLYRKLNSYRSK